MEESLSLRLMDEIKSTVPVRSGVFLFVAGLPCGFGAV